MELINITSGKITLSDPCYGLNTWCAIQDLPFPNGEYRVVVKKSDELDWGIRVSEIAIYNNDILPEENYGKEMDIWWKQLDGEVGVDSGQAGIFDADYYKKYHKDHNENEHVNDNWYDMACGLTLSDEQYGCTDSSGVVSSSGYGDSGYCAYIGELAGQVVAAKIVFIDNEDEEWEE